MKESLVSFGPSGGLSGVVTLPEHRRADAPTVVMLNSGLVHRVGSCRVSVTLARRLADSGHRAIRFDFSGIGDSLPGRSALGIEAGHVVEVGHALDFMQERFGCARFILYGLCSGAREAFWSAHGDARVVGVVQVDGYAYRTAQYFVHHYLPRVGKPSAWVRFVLRSLEGVRGKSDPTDHVDMVNEVWPDYPPRQEVEDAYRDLIRRRVRCFVIFTRSWADQYNYRRQFHDMFKSVDFGDLLSLLYMPHASHILPEPTVQESVVEEVTGWARQSFDGG